MEALFMKLINMSYQATIVLGFVLVARLFLELFRAPKKYCCLLWAIPFLRMIFPLNFESVFSLMPQRQTLATIETGLMATPQIASQIAGGNPMMNVVVNQSMPSAVDAVSKPAMNWPLVLGIVWFVGVVLYLTYGLVSYLQLKNKLRCSMCLLDNIYLADYIHTPFVLGVLRPRIYLPSATTKEEYRYVLAHERMHLKRKDHMYKLVTFLVLGFHWFNPFAWVAYFLLCKDMEMACDEAVMAQFGDECKKEYAKALLDWSAGKKLRGVPLAFSEGSVKGRIRNVLRYKKPLIGISVVAVVAIVVLAVCLLSDPVSEKNNGENLTVKEGTYILLTEEETDELLGRFPSVTISGDTMSFSIHLADSYWPHGNYKIDGDILTLTTREARKYRFRIEGDCLIFMAEGSVDIPSFEMKGTPEVVDGDVFKYVKPIDIFPVDIEVSTTLLFPQMDAGADGAILDYADERIVIFHGYFGLFVYDKMQQSLVATVDLEPIGCNYTQGDETCEVWVAADGSKVYLCPMMSNMMYVYNVTENSLAMEPHDLSGVEISEPVKDGQLFSTDGTIGKLFYKDMDGEEYSIFQNYFVEEQPEETKETTSEMEAFQNALQSNLYSMVLDDLARTGMTFTVYNNSKSEMQFGDDYKLYKMDGKEWVEVPYVIESGKFHMLAYPVDIGGSRQETVDWEWLYGELPDGSYLFKKPVMIKNDAGEWEKIELGVMLSFPVLVE